MRLDRTPEALQAFEKSNRLKEEAVVSSPLVATAGDFLALVFELWS